MREKCLSKLRELTGKKYVLFVKRGNAAIRIALKLFKKIGYTTVVLQDQGGWITYKQFCEKEKLEIQEIKTDYGIIYCDHAKDCSDCVLLINSMPGYHALQDMHHIEDHCVQNNILIINDASGSIGTKEATVGELIIGSFGEHKPLNLGTGGFIATNHREFFEFLEQENPEYDIDFRQLFEAFEKLDDRLDQFKEVRNKILKDLTGHDIIHRDYEGINVIVKFDSDSEKEKLINYCSKNNLEYTLCPRYIRVLDDAISIEVKRIK